MSPDSFLKRTGILRHTPAGDLYQSQVLKPHFEPLEKTASRELIQSEWRNAAPESKGAETDADYPV